MTMTVYEFLEKLNNYYPSKEKTEILEQKFNDYANCIIEYAHKNNYEYDYDKVFKQFMLNYKYKVFPSLPDILEFMPYGVIIKKPHYSGKEGQTIKRSWQGHEYEFTIVPDSWENVKTIKQLDNELERRKENGENARTTSF